MKYRITLLFIIFISLTSCSTIIRNIFGNKLIDMHYAPNSQKKLFYTEIPYKIENGFIIIKAKINNSIREYNFIFDTGAITMVSEKLNSELKLENGITVVSRDINGNDVSGLSYLTTLTIGELNVENIRINSTESDMFSQKCNIKIDGIIGANILNQGCFYFDSANKKLTITNEVNKLPIEKLKNPIKLKRFMGQPYIKVRGENNQWLLLDTGYADGNIILNLNSKILCKTDIPIKLKETYIKGIKKEQKINFSIYNKKIKLGKTENLMRIIQFKKNSGNGNIGNNIIQKSDVIIDTKHKKFYIANLNLPKLNDSILNINFKYKQNVVIVSSLGINSEIQKMGIKLNDTITKINNQSLLNLNSECEFEDFKSKYIRKNSELKVEYIKNNKTENRIFNFKNLYE